MCQWDDNSFMQCKNCFVKLNQKVIPWPWPYQWIRCPGCSAQYVYDKKAKYPREAKECKLLSHNSQAWAPKIEDKHDKDITDPDIADPKPFNMQFDGDNSPTFKLLAKTEPPETLLRAPPLLELDSPEQLETKVKIEGKGKKPRAPRISILADVAINFSMLVAASSQDGEEVSCNESEDSKDLNSSGR